MVAISTVFDCEFVSAFALAPVEALEVLVLVEESAVTPSRFSASLRAYA